MPISRRTLFIFLPTLALALGGFAAVQSGTRAIRERIIHALGPQSELTEIRIGLSGIELIGLKIKAPASGNGQNTHWPADTQAEAGRIVVVPSYMDILAGKMTIDTLRIENATFVLLRTREGALSFLPSLLGKSSQTETRTPAAPPVSEASDTPPSLFIKRITVINGALDFFDASVRTPPQRLRLEQIDAAIGRLTLPSLEGVSPIDLTGSVKGSKQDGKISISGTTEFAKRESGLTLRLQNIELPMLQAYIFKGGENSIKSGTLDADLNASIKNGVLHAPGSLTLNRLELASSSGTLMGMRRAILLSAMKQRNDRITLRYVLKGDLKDPGFSVADALSIRLGPSLASALGVSVDTLTKGNGIEKKGDQ